MVKSEVVKSEVAEKSESPESGSAETAKAKLPPILTPEKMRDMAISSAFGLVTAFVVFYIAFQQTGEHMIELARRMTYLSMERIAVDLAIFQRENDIYPKSLEAFAESTREVTSELRSGRPLDQWGRPMEYRSDGLTYELRSFADDGRSGGIGTHSDIVTTNDYDFPENLNPTLAAGTPTFRQFALELDTIPYKCVAFLGGTLAFGGCLLALRRTKSDRRLTALWIAVTLAATLGLTSVLSHIHYNYLDSF